MQTFDKDFRSVVNERKRILDTLITSVIFIVAVSLARTWIETDSIDFILDPLVGFANGCVFATFFITGGNVSGTYTYVPEAVWSYEPDPDMWILGSTMEESADDALEVLGGTISTGDNVTIYRADATPDTHIANELDNSEMTHRISNIVSVIVTWDGVRWTTEH